VDKTFDENFKRLDYMRKHSKMNFDLQVADKEKMKDHIDYQPKSIRESLPHSNRIQHEFTIQFKEEGNKDKLLRILMLSPDEKINALKDLVAAENDISLARSTINRHVTSRDLTIALLVEKLIPCILHMKLRVFEKIFVCLINTALERYGDSTYDSRMKQPVGHRSGRLNELRVPVPLINHR
jgi:hypothetical protein